MARIKGAKKLPGVDDIMLPGEGGSARCAAVVSAGVVRVEKNLYEGMKKVRQPWSPGVSPIVAEHGCCAEGGEGGTRMPVVYYCTAILQKLCAMRKLSSVLETWLPSDYMQRTIGRDKRFVRHEYTYGFIF